MAEEMRWDLLINDVRIYNDVVHAAGSVRTWPMPCCATQLFDGRMTRCGVQPGLIDPRLFTIIWVGFSHRYCLVCSSRPAVMRLNKERRRAASTSTLDLFRTQTIHGSNPNPCGSGGLRRPFAQRFVHHPYKNQQAWRDKYWKTRDGSPVWTRFELLRLKSLCDRTGQPVILSD